MKHGKAQQMKTQTERKTTTQPRTIRTQRPAGEQAISTALYQAIRQAVRELSPAGH